MECEYCHKKYSSVSSLNHHKKTNKKCLLLYQGETVLTLPTIACSYCDKKFMSNKTLKVHLSGFCMLKKKEEEIIELKKQLIKKDNDYKELAMKAVTEPRTVINNNTITNYNEFLMPFQSVDDICKNIEEKFTEDHFSQGQRGVAYFARDYLLTDIESGKPTYYCTDTGRKKFVMKDKDGMIVKDYKCVKLTQLIVSGGIVTKSNRMYNTLLANINEDQEKVNSESYMSYNNKRIVCRKNLGEIQELETNNGKFTTVLSNIICNPPKIEQKDNEEIEIEFEIEEEEEEEEEDLSKYTPEYFARKEALIEKEYRENSMYKLFKRQLEEERARYGGEKNRE